MSGSRGRNQVLDTAQLRALFDGLQRRSVDPPAGLDERCLDGVETAISAQDLAELSTSAFVLGFLRPVLDLWAHLLGFDEQGERSE